MRLDAPITCCQSLHGNLNIISLHQLVLDPAKLHNSIEVPVPRFSRIRQFVVKHNSFASLPCSKVSIETLFAFTALWNNSPSRPNRDLRSFGKAGLTFPSDIIMVCNNASGLFDRKSAFARLLSLNETSVENYFRRSHSKNVRVMQRHPNFLKLLIVLHYLVLKFWRDVCPQTRGDLFFNNVIDLRCKLFLHYRHFSNRVCSWNWPEAYLAFLSARWPGS